MNPKEIGKLDEPPPPPKEEPAEAPPATPPTDEKSPESEEEDESVFVAPKCKPSDDETVLVNQEFLLDPDLTVREFLVQNSIEVVEFIRFECGEELEENSPPT